MPRHPLGETAMTDAERQRKRRERLRKERGPTIMVETLWAEIGLLAGELAAARAEIARLKQQLAAKAAGKMMR